MRRQVLVFEAPGRVAVIEEALPAPAAGQLLVRTRVSAISAGTELLAYRGQLPAELALDETLPALGAGAAAAAAAAPATFSYPFRYGYASVGVVEAVGGELDAGWIGRRVFAFQPHASAFLAGAAQVIPVPDELGDEEAALLANQETAVNLLLDGAPRLGERVVVVGLGVVGLLTVALLGRFPLAALVAIEPVAARAARGRRLGADVVADAAAARARLTEGGADLSFELTGDPRALDSAIAVTGREGRVVVGSFYGQKRAPVNLGDHFHRGRLTLQSSQVSHLAPALSGRWDKARRLQTAWRALAGSNAAAELVTHRFPLARAAEAYRLLDTGAPEALQVLLMDGHPSQEA